MDMKHKLIIAVILITTLSCKKKVYEHCTNAKVCVTNRGTQAIPYSWGGSQLKDTLLPGQTACKDAGFLDTDPSSQSYSIVYFMMPSKSLAIRPTSCNTQQDVP